MLSFCNKTLLRIEWLSHNSLPVLLKETATENDILHEVFRKGNYFRENRTCLKRTSSHPKINFLLVLKYLFSNQLLRYEISYNHLNILGKTIRQPIATLSISGFAYFYPPYPPPTPTSIYTHLPRTD